MKSIFLNIFIHFLLDNIGRLKPILKHKSPTQPKPKTTQAKTFSQLNPRQSEPFRIFSDSITYDLKYDPILQVSSEELQCTPESSMGSVPE